MRSGGERAVGAIDPASIDLDLACRMSRGWCLCDDFPERMCLERRGFPRIIDFDDYAKVEAPEGWAIHVPENRDITIRVTCFPDYVCGSTHNYCEIEFMGLVLVDLADPGRWVRENPVTGRELKEPFGYMVRLDIEKPVTEDDLRHGSGDWTGFEVGGMCHRWPTAANAIECARRVVGLRFRNHGEILVDDCGRDGE